MQHHRSLKHRLLLLTLATVVTVWLAATAFTYVDARKELNEMLDAHLAQSATLLVVQSSHEFDEVEIEHTPLLHKYSRRIAFQIWEDGKVLRLHSLNAPSQPLATLEHGFSDNVIEGVSWRVFSTWDSTGSNLIHIAERTEVRDKLAHNIAANLLTPLLITLPLLAMLLWIAVTRSLLPLVKLTSEIAQRAPDNLTALDTQAAPREVVPLIERLNQLFDRMALSLQKERGFTADAAHELRTPVAIIKAQAQVAKAAIHDAERNHALDNAILGCDRAAHLIEQLLTLARIDTLSENTTEPCALRHIAAEVIAETAPAALKENIRLELTEGSEAVVRGNPALLRILLRNLIDNAVRHTQANTLVWVTIHAMEAQIILSVNDDGPGLEEAEFARLAERFYRPAGTVASGSGLGLSIVKRIAEIHHASLKIAARQEGKGLRVSVIFNT